MPVRFRAAPRSARATPLARGGVRAAALCLAAAALAAPADAATLRLATSLPGPVVKLSDLFDDAGGQAARVLGPAPAPGERIVVGAAQLAAIARQFGVDWRPASGADRAVLDRPGKPLARDLLLAALREALAHAGAAGRLDLELPGFAAPLLALDAAPAVTVEQADYDAASGHFSASVLVDGANMAPLRLRLEGQASELVELAVPARRLPAGTVLRETDLVRVTLRAAEAREAVREPAEAVGMALRHAVAAGRPLPLAELQPPLLVAKGAHVAMRLRAPGLSVSALGVALRAGALGERIDVLNPASRMVVEGEVSGPDQVTVAPDSVPVPAGDQVAAR